jgi:hypothetical protein
MYYENHETLSIILLCAAVLLLLDALINRFIFYTHDQEEQVIFTSPARLISQTALVLILLAGSIDSFSGSWNSYSNTPVFFAVAFTLVIITLAFGAVIFIPYKRNYFKKFETAAFYIMICLIFCFSGKFIWIFSNILLLGLGVYYIIIGGKKLRLSQLNFGMLLIMFIIILRFFDLDLGLLQRGIAFIILGIIFFACNLLMFKKKKEKPQ